MITPTKDTHGEVHKHSRTIEFDGAETETITGYSHRGKAWIPDTAVAGWPHNQPIADITVTGAVLKKDGNPSQNRVEERYVTPASKGWNTSWNTNAPEWLLELFADSHHTTPEASE